MDHSGQDFLFKATLYGSKNRYAKKSDWQDMRVKIGNIYLYNEMLRPLAAILCCFRHHKIHSNLLAAYSKWYSASTLERHTPANQKLPWNPRGLSACHIWEQPQHWYKWTPIETVTRTNKPSTTPSRLFLWVHTQVNEASSWLQQIILYPASYSHLHNMNYLEHLLPLCVLIYLFFCYTLNKPKKTCINFPYVTFYKHTYS